jgi:long-chain acyl-CoA synthetase
MHARGPPHSPKNASPCGGGCSTPGVTPPLEPDRIGTLWDVLSFHASQRPSAVALQFNDNRRSYHDVLQASLGLAGELTRRGVGRGDRIGYLGKNSDRYFVLLYAIARIGAVLVPLNWRLAPDEWAFILRDADARLLFIDDGTREAGNSLTNLLGLPPAEVIPHSPPIATLDSATDAPRGSDVVLQVYTSGTTGRPKGAMLTHRNLLALRGPGYAAGLRWFPQAEDTTLVVLPVAHIAGTAYALFGLYGGGRVVITADFDPPQALGLIEAEGITHILLAPAAIRQVLDHPAAARTDFHRLRFVTYGASPIPDALLRRALDTFGCDFVQMYGMTEAAGGVVALSPEDHRSSDAKRLRSAGRAMPGVKIAILDAHGAALERDQIGEIAVHSAAVMSGYWKRPEATAEAIVADGWLRTGDIGRIDADGYVFVLDRAKDTIVSGGENIYPAEVENAIFGHPDVADVAVIGVPSERWGEEVMAVIVPRAGTAPDLESVARWARARIAAFKVPKRISLVAELPRNAGQKVLRRVLREPYWAGLQRRVN